MDEFWSDLKSSMKVRSAEKRAANRQSSAAMLTAAGIPFETKNGGAHLIVAGAYDFWPGTGLWKARGENVTRRGVRSLITMIQGRKA